MFTNLEGKFFFKLDLSNAYQQIDLEESSMLFTTINTHKGLYQDNKLCFGISPNPGIVQRFMDSILQGTEWVRVKLHGILIALNSVEGCNSRLCQVFPRLKEAGMILKKSICVFKSREVVYLGHKLTASGVEPLREKVEAIEEMERPKDKKELQRYLGLINYYAKFLPNISDFLSPLYRLLQKGQTFQCGEKEESLWSNSKKLLINSGILVHSDQSKDIIQLCTGT